MNKLTYLITTIILLISTSCRDNTNKETIETIVCSNTGEACLDNHSCCIIQKEVVDSVD